MIRDSEAFEVHERVRRDLAAEDRMLKVRGIYSGYYEWDWVAALLADVLLYSGHMKGDRDSSFEMDIVRAEQVAGWKVEGGALPSWRRRFPAIRKFLRDKAERPFFNYGSYER